MQNNHIKQDIYWLHRQYRTNVDVETHTKCLKSETDDHEMPRNGAQNAKNISDKTIHIHKL